MVAQRAGSTWSLHRTLGRFAAPDSAAGGGPFLPPPAAPGGISLLELPEALRAHGYDTLQICHFHLPSREAAYLAELRAALEGAGVTLDAVLVDDGDLTGPDADRDEAWIGEWLEVATALGATRARVGAGKADPAPETLQASATRLARLAADHPGVRLVTENWWAMLPDADAVLSLRTLAGESVGLLIDLGNWSGPGKYDELARIAPLAETCHAKCRFTDAGPDRDDYARALGVLKASGYAGPLALIYDGPDDDEWAGLDAEDAIVREVFGVPA